MVCDRCKMVIRSELEQLGIYPVAMDLGEIELEEADLSDKLLQDYNSLSNLFSETEATTIEKYYIQQKIERVKELLTYNELTINEIAFQLHYSSAAHLSNQFKKITGYSPTYFKQLKKNTRKEIDQS